MRYPLPGVAGLALASSLALAADRPPLGTPPPADAVPRLEFAFEERVTLDPAVVLGDTALGRRQYIPITGGTVAGPKLSGTVGNVSGVPVNASSYTTA